MSELKNVIEKLRRRSQVELQSNEVHLKDLNTLDKLLEQANNLLPEVKKLSDWKSMYDKKSIEYGKNLDKVVPKVQKAQEKATKLSIELERAEDELSVLEKERESILDSIKSNEDLKKDIDKKDNTDGKKARQVVADLEKNIQIFQDGAKKLGINVDVKQYLAAWSKLRDALPKS